MTSESTTTMNSSTASGLMTLGEAAEVLAVQVWRLQRAYDRRLLPDPVKIGRQRFVPVDQLESIRAVMVERGYVRKPQLAELR